ncbi:MAG TPA: RICIN domain-containing protein [Flavisolibacter sp.]|nr:RICIN domain-containing protein [Flavisolibacter sp.]
MRSFFRHFIVFLIAFLLQQETQAQKVENGGYQVQNKATGLVLRPFDARGEEGTPIVVYPQTTWRCMTWELKSLKDSGVYRFQNYFTGKTFTSTEWREGGSVVETSLDRKGGLTGWKIVPAGDGYYRIEAAASDWVLTVEGEGVNAKVVVKKWTKQATQLWKLLPKPERFTG